MALLLMLLCVGLSTIRSVPAQVSTYLYGAVQLPCSFPFVQGSEGLTVVWEKDSTGGKVMVHKFTDGKDVLTDQDPRFRGRTELSKKFTQGNLNLTLMDVTFQDEGTYSCKAAHKKGDGDMKVALTISDLNATNPTIIFTYVDGGQYLRCLSSGVFQNPKVRWFSRNATNLSQNSTITNLVDGRKMVDSVLAIDVVPNFDYFCQIQEGRLKRTVHAVLSDGNTPIYINTISFGTSISAWEIILPLLICTTIRIWIV